MSILIGRKPGRYALARRRGDFLGDSHIDDTGAGGAHAMMPSTRALVQDHRVIETELDRFRESLEAGSIDGEQFQRIEELLREHYELEKALFVRLRQHEPAFTDKLGAQHDEALELADRLKESMIADEVADSIYLARRLLAIAQHNMIEEERDAFPLAERCFRAEDTGGGSR